MDGRNTRKHNLDEALASEYLIARRWSLCRDSILRSTGYGALWGSLSLLLFGRAWTRLLGVGLGLGIGFGLGLAGCQENFARPHVAMSQGGGTSRQQAAATHTTSSFARATRTQ